MVAGNTSTGMNRPQQGMMQAQPMQAQPMQAQPMQQSPRPPGAAFGQPATMLPGMSPGMGGRFPAQPMPQPTLGQPLNPLQQQQMMGLMQQRQLQMQPATPTGAPTQVNAQPGNMSIDEFARSPLMGPTTMEMRNPVEFEGSMRDPELVRRYEQYRSGGSQQGQQRVAGQTFGPVPDSMRQMPVGGFGQPDQASMQAQLDALNQARQVGFPINPTPPQSPQGMDPQMFAQMERQREMAMQGITQADIDRMRNLQMSGDPSFQAESNAFNARANANRMAALQGQFAAQGGTPGGMPPSAQPGMIPPRTQTMAQQQMQPSMARTPMTGGLGGFFGRPRVTFGNNVQSAGQGISGLMRFFR